MNMQRRNFLKGVLASAVGLGLGQSVFAQAQRPNWSAAGKKPPNIIFLLTDDQCWNSLGCTGNSIIQTPNTDSLAREGVLFTNNFVTTSICNASRASIFTGQYMGTHQIINFSQDLTSEQESFSYPWVLKDAGYHTGFVGKYGVGNNMPAEDFDYWDGFGGQNVFFHWIDGQWKHLTEMLGDSAVKYLQGQNSDRPFCLSVSFKAPHVIDHLPDAFLPDPKYKDLYQDVEVPYPESRKEKYDESLPLFLKQSINRMRGWRYDTPERFQESVKDYYRTITGVDDVVGRIRSTLAQKGLADDTIIIFTSDNGYFLGEHQFDGKWLMYEESIRVPLIIYDPRMPANLRGREVDDMVLNIDYCPTMIEMAGLEVPGEIQGRSLMPFVRGEEPSRWRKDWFYEYTFEYPTLVKCEGVRGERWKYTRYVDQDPVYEQLFDLKNDPLEVRNLAEEPQFKSQLESMRSRYSELRKEYVIESAVHPEYPGRPDPGL